MGYREFPDVNRRGRPKAVTYIPILLGHYIQLPCFRITRFGKEGADFCATDVDVEGINIKFSFQYGFETD